MTFQITLISTLLATETTTETFGSELLVGAPFLVNVIFKLLLTWKIFKSTLHATPISFSNSLRIFLWYVRNIWLETTSLSWRFNNRRYFHFRFRYRIVNKFFELNLHVRVVYSCSLGCNWFAVRIFFSSWNIQKFTINTRFPIINTRFCVCLLYTSDAADE